MTSNPYASSLSLDEELPAAVAFRLPRLRRVLYFLAIQNAVGVVFTLFWLEQFGALEVLLLALPNLVLVVAHLILAKFARVRPMLSVHIAIGLFAVFVVALPALVEITALASGLVGKALAVVLLIFAYNEARVMQSHLR